MKEIMTICGIECYEENGVAYLKLENVARGLWFTQVAASGNEVVRWERVRKYLNELGIPTSGDGVNVPDFISENIFYRLAMKAKNAVAETFQAMVVDEVIPSIRKHGAYLTPAKIDEILNDPDVIIKLATIAKEERAKNKALELENAQQKQIIGELKPKADYTKRLNKIEDKIRTAISYCSRGIVLEKDDDFKKAMRELYYSIDIFNEMRWEKWEEMCK